MSLLEIVYLFDATLQFKLCMLQENIHKVQLMKPAISKGSFKPTTKNILSYFPGYGEFKKNFFGFRSPKENGVTCICLQCSRHKQNCYHSLGKTAFINKHAIDFKVIAI